MNLRPLTISLQKTDRTDLCCIACLKFHTDFAVMVDGAESVVGVHRRCLPAVRRRRGSAAAA